MIGFINNLYSGPSLLIILALVLIFFGAKRLPELARSLGLAIREFDKAKNEPNKPGDSIESKESKTPEPPKE